MSEADKLRAYFEAIGENEKIYRLILGACLAPIALLGSKFEVLSTVIGPERIFLTAALVLLLLASGLAVSAVSRTHTCRRNLLHINDVLVAFGTVKRMESLAEALNGFAILFGGLGYLSLLALFLTRVWGS